MDNSLKSKWVEALRSDEYKQGSGVLRRQGQTKDGYCCLGVLCDITDPTQWVERSPLYMWGECRCFPPVESMTRWGISYTQAKQLMLMNDNGISFSEIANYIESNL
jgi:hypothetical protein